MYKKLLAVLLAAMLIFALAAPAMAAGETAAVSNQKFTVNGKSISVFASILINGENYLKIRDIALLLKGTSAEFAMDYANATVAIKTHSTYDAKGIGMSTAKPSDMKLFQGESKDKVTINGKAVAFKVYKYDNANYFRLKDFESIGAIVGYNNASSTALLATVPTAKSTITVHAAASLKSSIEKIIAQFSAEYPNITIELNTGGSGALKDQILEGAGGDLFISADEANMDKLAAGNGIVTESRTNLLKNTLVLIVPKGNPNGVTSFEDVITKCAGKNDVVAVGKSVAVPAGDRAFEVYKYLGLEEQFKKLVINECADVSAVRNTVASGDAVAGFVYATDAASVADKVDIIATAPEESHLPVIYPGAVLSDSKNQDVANAFLTYLSTDAAKKIFTDAKFTIA